MCRERTREPAWVGAIRLAILTGRVDVGGVMAESNLPAGWEPTVVDVLETMEERGLLEPIPSEEGGTGTDGRYRIGPVLMDSAPDPSSIASVSDRGVHRWDRAGAP